MENLSKDDYIKILLSIISIIFIIVLIRFAKVHITDSSTPKSASANEKTATSKTDSVSVAILGNVMISNKMRNNYKLNGLSGIISDDLSSTIKNADIAIMNQTFSLSGADELNYSVSSNDLEILQDMGINMVSFANKYFRRYGTDSIISTFANLKNSSIQYAGAGMDVFQASDAAYFTCNNKTIGLLSVMKLSSDTNEGIAVNSNGYERSKNGIYGESSTDSICDSIQNAKDNCDFLIVNISWEKENTTKITKEMKNDAHSFIKSGADIVTGCNDKILDTEYYKDKPIIYGTGNFLNTATAANTNVYYLTIHQNNTCKIQEYDCKTDAYYVKKS